MLTAEAERPLQQNTEQKNKSFDAAVLATGRTGW